MSPGHPGVSVAADSIAMRSLGVDAPLRALIYPMDLEAACLALIYPMDLEAAACLALIYPMDTLRSSIESRNNW